uniref:Endosulfine alpha n=1 Tax=Monodon monoceros TaxID=40151 RepID=A0A8C6FCC2_MONMO
MYPEVPEAKGQKGFDSGDYSMAKAKMKNKQLPTTAPNKTEVTGDHIPTPQDLPQRKPSLVASKPADGLKELKCMNLLIPIISS